LIESEYCIAPDLACVAIPGGLPSDRSSLLAALHAQWQLDLISFGQRLKNRPHTQELSQFLMNLSDWLINASADQSNIICSSVVFGSWITRLSRVVDKGSESLLNRHIVGLSHIVSLEIAAPFCNRSLPSVVQRDGRIFPASGKWHVKTQEQDCLRVLIEFSCDKIRFLDSERNEIATLARRQNAEHVEWHVANAGRLRFDSRNFISGGIELLSDEYCPELARGEGDVPCSLGNDIISRQLRDCLSTLELIWPEAIGDIHSFVRAIVPRESTKGHWNSASTSDLPCVIQVTFNKEEEPLLLAESILHEMSHVKLDIAMRLAPLLSNGPEKIYRHPWRGDLRPMLGVLLGAHAFLAVMLMYQKAVAIGFDRDFAWHEYKLRQREVGEALSVLEDHAVFTDAGQQVYEHMRKAYREALA
jgi:HEXXH motif-containing protein